MFDHKKGPLINSVLWFNDEPHQVNFHIKNILKLFVNYISIDFAEEHIHILAVSNSYRPNKIQIIKF